jgi:hypothetical protein
MDSHGVDYGVLDTAMTRVVPAQTPLRLHSVLVLRRHQCTSASTADLSQKLPVRYFIADL